MKKILGRGSRAYRKPCSPRPVGTARGPARARHSPVASGPVPARPDGPGRVWAATQAHGTARARHGGAGRHGDGPVPYLAQQATKAGNGKYKRSAEARSPARLPPIPHSLPASPIPNPNPHSLSLARSLSLCSRSRSTAATAIGPVLGSGDLAGAPPLHLANPVRLSPSPPSFPSPLALGEP